MSSTHTNVPSRMSAPNGMARDMLHPTPLFSPEMELLFCCGGPRILASNGDRASLLLRRDLDWELVFRLASFHGMLPLLYWNLLQRDGEQNGVAVPSPAMDAFRTAYLRNVGQALRMTADLLAILEKLEHVSVPAVPYKGPVLSSRLYGNLGLRRSVDLDILVLKEHLKPARHALIELGYSPSVILQGPTQEFQVESRYSERFDRPGSVVELHWAFTNKDVAFPMSLEELMPRLRTHPVSGRLVRVFSLEDTLLILCVHGAKHGWARLEWLCGVAEAVCGSEDIDWPDLMSRATATGALRRLLLGLCLVHDLFRAPLPDYVKEEIRRDRRIADLAAAVSSSLFDKDIRVEGIQTFGSLDHDLFHFRLADRLSDSFRYLAYRVTTPSRSEQWSTISVGGRSIALHSLTRPVGIIMKVVPAMWRRISERHLHASFRSSSRR